MSETKQPIDDIRKQIRNGILNAKADRRELVLFGQTVELVQPPLNVILGVQSGDDASNNMAQTIIRYIYVPGTNTPVFEEVDIQAILRLPFGPDVQRLQNAISDLTGIEAEVAEQAKNFVSSQDS